MVDEFFESEYTPALQVVDKSDGKNPPELPKTDNLDGPATLDELVEIIYWYHHFIYVKLMRSIRGILGNASEVWEDFPKDSDGSAKVALIAIDRSLAAWGQMHNYFPGHREQILAIIMHLDRLCRRVEKIFPEARNFRRPGFDGPPQQDLT